MIMRLHSISSLFVLSCLLFSPAGVQAQTADNLLTSISWEMNSGTITEAPDFTPETAIPFILKAEIEKGSGLKEPIAKTSEIEGITQTIRTRLQIWCDRYGVILMKSLSTIKVRCNTFVVTMATRAIKAAMPVSV